jgi:L-serine dehydratase
VNAAAARSRVSVPARATSISARPFPRPEIWCAHVSERFRHFQDRRRSVLVPHDGADDRRRAVPRRPARRPEKEPGAGDLAALACSLHGSLAFTGKGHATDRAVILGLSGFEPATLDPDRAELLEAEVRETGMVTPPGLPPLSFAPDTDLIFDYGPPLPGHANGMILRAFDTAGNLYLEETYYSIGGGFVMTARELDRETHGGAEAFHEEKAAAGYPHPFGSAQEMLAMGKATGKTIAEMKWANETANASPAAVRRDLDAVWQAMDDCIERGPCAWKANFPAGCG